MKLTPKQQEVLKLMAEGWELGHDLSMDGRHWLQKDGCGRGGESFAPIPHTRSGAKDLFSQWPANSRWNDSP